MLGLCKPLRKECPEEDDDADITELRKNQQHPHVEMKDFQVTVLGMRTNSGVR